MSSFRVFTDFVQSWGRNCPHWANALHTDVVPASVLSEMNKLSGGLLTSAHHCICSRNAVALRYPFSSLELHFS